MSAINSNGSMAFGNSSGGSVTIIPKNDTATNYTIDIDDVSGTLATQEWANSQDLGVGQTWQDLTASRASNTTYTNSTGRPIQVINGHTGSGGGSPSWYIDDVLMITAPTNSNGAGVTSVMAFIVPNGSTYKFDGVVSSWLELR